MEDDKKVKLPMEQQADDLHHILGYGSKLQILWGTKKSVEDESKLVEDIREIHLAPCSLKDIPEMFAKLNLFFDNVAQDIMKTWTPEKVKDAARIIFLSTRKMHEDLTEDIILEKFGMGGLAKAIRIAMDINDFLSEVTVMNKQMAEAATTSLAQKK